ncbi:NAD(P)-dependent oxidoreductase [Jatrophihabitans fulvus]
MRLAVLGTGTMGAGMARSAKRAGLDVVVWNRSADKARPLADDGIEVADSVAAAVSGADVVMTILFDVDSVLGIADELLGALGDDAVWLQSATVGPDGIRRIAAAAGSAALVDAPVLGTRTPAEQGKLTPLVSGDREAIARAKPVLDAIGAKTIVAGDRIGDASALKLVANAWIGSITAAAGQSIALADKLGVDPNLFLQALDGSAVDSPYAQLKGKAMIGEDWTTSFAVDGVRKDLGLIIEAAAGAGVATDVLTAVKRRFDAASEQGHGDDDMASVRTAFSR